MLVGAVVLSLALTSSVLAGEIKIGTVLPLSGALATFGQASLNGMRLAVDEINAAGGVKGQKVVLISEDNKSDATETVNAVSKLITRDNVLAIIGPVTSTDTRAAAPIAQRYGIPFLSGTATAEGITAIGDYIFRICFVDTFQGKVVARFARDQLKLKKVGILRALTSEQSVGLTKVFKEHFEKLGGQVVIQDFNEGDQDVSAQLTRLKAAGIDGLFIPSYYNDVGPIARQARQVGLTVPILGTDGFDSPKLYELGGEAIVGAYFSNHYSTAEKRPIAVKFLQAYEARYKMPPDALAALGYDSVRVLLDAIKRAKDLEGKSIRDALAATRNFPAVTGDITLDKDRNPLNKSAVILRVDKGGRFTFVTRVNP